MKENKQIEKHTDYSYEIEDTDQTNKSFSNVDACCDNYLQWNPENTSKSKNLYLQMSEIAIAQLHKELIKHGISLDNKQLDNKEFIKYIKK